MCNSTVCAAIMSVVSALLVVLLLMQHKSASLDFYSSSSQLVTLRTTSTGLRKKYLHVSPANGLVRTDGNSSGAPSSTSTWLRTGIFFGFGVSFYFGVSNSGGVSFRAGIRNFHYSCSARCRLHPRRYAPLSRTLDCESTN